MSAALALGAIPTALHIASAALCLWRLSRPAPQPAARPRVTLLRPVCGLDPFDALTLGSSFDLEYPDVEILFCAAQETDPAVPVLRDLIARHPQVSARLLIGDDRPTANPKLNNLAKGWAEARGDLIVMTDANLLLPPDYLDRLVTEMRSDTGLVTSPPVGIRPEGLWGAVEAAFLNGFQARWQLAADCVGLGFAQGKTLMWRPDVLHNAGGLCALASDLAEDVAATKIVRRQGLKVRLAARPFGQPIGRRDLPAVWNRQLRWSRVRRDGFPALFLLEILLGPLAPALGLAGAGGAAWLPAFLLLWYATEWGMTRAYGLPSRPVDVLAALLRDVSLPVLWLATWARRGISWRGTTLEPVPQ